MVVTFFPATLFITVEQERTGWASTCTVQAPQSDIPQPNFVPVSPMTSRRIQSSGISGATSTVREVPFKVKVMLAIVGVRWMVTGSADYGRQGGGCQDAALEDAGGWRGRMPSSQRLFRTELTENRDKRSKSCEQPSGDVCEAVGRAARGMD